MSKSNGPGDSLIIGQLDGELSICCHRVIYRWWRGKGPWPCTPLLKSRLEEAAEERATQCIHDGCGSGQLVHAENGGHTFIGWWEIKR